MSVRFCNDLNVDSIMRCGRDIHMFSRGDRPGRIGCTAERIMPIHWGAFKLGKCIPWTEPVDVFSKKAKELNLGFNNTKNGEPINIDKQKAPPRMVE